MKKLQESKFQYYRNPRRWFNGRVGPRRGDWATGAGRLGHSAMQGDHASGVGPHGHRVYSCTCGCGRGRGKVYTPPLAARGTQRAGGERRGLYPYADVRATRTAPPASAGAFGAPVHPSVLLGITPGPPGRGSTPRVFHWAPLTRLQRTATATNSNPFQSPARATVSACAAITSGLQVEQRPGAARHARVARRRPRRRAGRPGRLGAAARAAARHGPVAGARAAGRGQPVRRGARAGGDVVGGGAAAPQLAHARHRRRPRLRPRRRRPARRRILLRLLLLLLLRVLHRRQPAPAPPGGVEGLAALAALGGPPRQDACQRLHLLRLGERPRRRRQQPHGRRPRGRLQRLQRGARPASAGRRVLQRAAAAVPGGLARARVPPRAPAAHARRLRRLHALSLPQVAVHRAFACAAALGLRLVLGHRRRVRERVRAAAGAQSRRRHEPHRPRPRPHSAARPPRLPPPPHETAALRAAAGQRRPALGRPLPRGPAARAAPRQLLRRVRPRGRALRGDRPKPSTASAMSPAIHLLPCSRL